MIGNISTSIEKNVLNILSQSKTEINYMNLNMILMILSSTLIKYDVKLKKGDSKLNKAINVIILFLNYNFILCHNHNNLNVNLITNYNNHYLCHILFKFNI